RDLRSAGDPGGPVPATRCDVVRRDSDPLHLAGLRPEPGRPPHMTSPILEVRDAAKRFGGVMAVQDVSFDVRSGEILGLIGPNGAGKTTLVNLITGVSRPSYGSIAFEGRALAGLRPHQIGRLGIARTFQVVRPFANLSVLENVAVGAMFGAGGSRRS